MKKILILSMFCNQQFFKDEEKAIRETWVKQIEEFNNIMFYSYTASEDGKYHVIGDRLYVPCDDSLFGTAEKTVKALRLVESLGIEYDYLFRTNTSTYVNIPLLNQFTQTLYDSSVMWCGNGCIAFIDTGPVQYSPIAGGNALLLSKKRIREILKRENIEKAIEMDKFTDISNTMSRYQNAIYKIDDNFISFIHNTISIRDNEDMYKKIRCYGLVGCDSYIDMTFDNIEKYIVASYRLGQREAGEIELCRALDQIYKDKISDKINLDKVFDHIFDNKITMSYLRDKQHLIVYDTVNSCLSLLEK